jgi:putative transcriptional regulator
VSIRRLLLALILCVVPLASRAALDPSTGGDAPPAKPGIISLSGQLLVAAPDMPDPRFANTVILVVRHDQNGALGIVINRPVEERPYADLLKALGDKDIDVRGSVRIFAGGPVQPELGFVVHSAEYHRPGTVAVNGQVSLTSSPDVLRDMAHGKGPHKAIVAFGYAGWGPGQLDNEISHGSWFTASADPALVFDEDRAKLWDAAMAHRTINL